MRQLGNSENAVLINIALAKQGHWQKLITTVRKSYSYFNVNFFFEISQNSVNKQYIFLWNWLWSYAFSNWLLLENVDVLFRRCQPLCIIWLVCGSCKIKSGKLNWVIKISFPSHGLVWIENPYWRAINTVQ